MSGKGWRSLSLRWTLSRGSAAVVLFLALAVLIEYMAVRSAILSGITDAYALPIAPGLALSPLFHLLPLCVITVLTASWFHLTKYTWLLPKKREKPGSERLGRFQSLRFFFLRLLGPSYLVGRPSFAAVALKEALTVLALFLAFFMLGYVLAYPRLVETSVVSFYNANPSFLGFMNTLRSSLDAVAQTLAPIGWVASAVDGALKSAAPGFRGSLEGLGTLTEPLVRLDAFGKYVFCQNLAALLPALATILYCRRFRPKIKRYRGK